MVCHSHHSLVWCSFLLLLGGVAFSSLLLRGAAFSPHPPLGGVGFLPCGWRCFLPCHRVGGAALGGATFQSFVGVVLVSPRSFWVSSLLLHFLFHTPRNESLYVVALCSAMPEGRASTTSFATAVTDSTNNLSKLKFQASMIPTVPLHLVSHLSQLPV